MKIPSWLVCYLPFLSARTSCNLNLCRFFTCYNHFCDFIYVCQYFSTIMSERLLPWSHSHVCLLQSFCLFFCLLRLEWGVGENTSFRTKCSNVSYPGESCSLDCIQGHKMNAFRVAGTWDAEKNSSLTFSIWSSICLHANFII